MRILSLALFSIYSAYFLVFAADFKSVENVKWIRNLHKIRRLIPLMNRFGKILLGS
jgi:hypothetical protein